MSIGVLDYGAGNLKNVCRAIDHLGFNYRLVSTVDGVHAVDKLIIPGVGAFKVAMEQLEKLGLTESLRQLAEKGIPIMGICLGMQLLFEQSSEFGVSKGIGLIKGEINKIPSVGINGHQLKVPHIGWNELIINKSILQIVNGIETDDPVYFVHSYRVEGIEESDLVAYCTYDGLVIPSIVKRRNIIGCQFHPEKSGEIGLKIFDNFLRSV
ncbi:MAG: imidazole glycerol phosphate synthase subunit HisH [Gammaproteobacteria bacterium]|nr:MAG: imidazole glycerol phosphate synthase subunit HisH [Gammaproteobacteria bacterium]